LLTGAVAVFNSGGERHILGKFRVRQLILIMLTLRVLAGIT
jgi:hypothetical protein